MKPSRTQKKSPASLLFGIILLCEYTHSWAGAESECIQEAEEFGVAPEQFEDYVSACIYSRGGNIPDITPSPEEAAIYKTASDSGKPDSENEEMYPNPTPAHNQ